MKITKGRLNRKNFIIGFIIFAIIEVIASIPALMILFTNPQINPTELENYNYMFDLFSVYSQTGIIFHIISIVVILWSLQIYTRRFHDIGKTGVLSFIILINFLVARGVAHLAHYYINTNQVSSTTLLIQSIPGLFSILSGILALYLILKKGEPVANKFGDVPSDKVTIMNILFNG